MINARNERMIEIRGLSSDIKPVNKYIKNGSQFIEIDTGSIWFYDESNMTWFKSALPGSSYVPSNPGGSGSDNVPPADNILTWNEVRDMLEDVYGPDVVPEGSNPSTEPLVWDKFHNMLGEVFGYDVVEDIEQPEDINNDLTQDDVNGMLNEVFGDEH